MKKEELKNHKLSAWEDYLEEKKTGILTSLKRGSRKALAVLLSGMLALGTALPVCAAEDKENKAETVYVNAAADGSVDSITVSEWLKNLTGSDSLEDYSELTNIKNVKGDEEFKQNSDGSIVWDSNGNDIYYQGETDEELPVSMKVTYYLDGKEISPDELAGKSGEVKIRFDYYNNTSDTVKVDDEKITVQTPFTMVTAMILPSDVFSNVEVDNGKVISDGDKNIVVGLAFPGLKSSLKLDTYDALSDVSIPESVEVTADAEDFELALTATVATTGSLSDLDLGDLDDADDLKDDIDQLTDAADQLVDGTEQLLDGMNTLSSSFGTYASGVDAVDAGAKELAEGLETLDSKKEELAGGVSTLSKGLSSLKSGTETLSQGITSYTLGVSSLADGLGATESGSSQLKAGTDALSQGVTDYTNGATQLDQGIQSLAAALSSLDIPDEEALSQVNDAAEALGEDAKNLQEMLTELDELVGGLDELDSNLQSYQAAVKSARESLDSVDEKATEQVQEQLRKKAESAKSVRDSIPLGDTIISDEEIESQIESIKVEGAADEAKAILDKVLEIQLPSLKVDTSAMTILLNDMQKQAKVLETFAGSVSGLTGEIPKLEAGVGQLSAGSKALTSNNEALLQGMQSLSAGIDTLATGVSQLEAGAEELEKNNQALTSGASALTSGSSQLVSGSSQLESGVSAFNSGVGAASDGADQLQSGTGQLADATGQVSDGINQLAEGAEELNDGMNEFNEEGIQKIADLAGEDLETVINQFKAVKKADENYNSYAGIKEKSKGSVKFIIETAAIEK
jgi:putative membrane protein